MSTIVPPVQTRTFGVVKPDGTVEVNIQWYRYLVQDLFDRVGGFVGPTINDLAAAQFEDAGIEEMKALAYSNSDASNQSPEVSALREELAALRSRVEAMEQGVSL